MPLTLPPDSAIDAIHAGVTRITRRVDIYEADRVTPWAFDVNITDGSVDIDQGRDERRTVDLVLENLDDSMTASPDGLWYDKVIKVYRGIEYYDDGLKFWEAQLGEFLIDNLDSPHFPKTTSVKGRDYAKRLSGPKFAAATLFPKNHPIEEAIRDIAFAGGLPQGQMDLPLTGESLGQDYVFEPGAERFSSMKDIAISYGYELFFDVDGMLRMREFQDPYLIPASYTFRTGQLGNLVGYSKAANDSRLFNHIVVSGENASQVPVWGQAENTTPGSPTAIGRIGRRTDPMTLAFVETQSQATEVAERFLKTSALEQYSISLESIVVPYIDVGVIVQFDDPNPGPNDPNKFLMQQVKIPLTLGAMSGTAGRVIQIEAS